MKEQKAYHRRKLAIIEMIESCDEEIQKGTYFLQRIVHDDIPSVKLIAKDNINRFRKIKTYLTERYNR